MLQIAGDLWDQHHIGTGGNAGLQGNPTGLLTQDLHHRDFPGRPGRLISLVQHFDGGAESGVEPEGNRRGGDIVLDGPGNTHRMQPFEMQLVEDLQPLVAHGGDQGLKLCFLEPLQQLIRKVSLGLICGGCMKGINSGCLAKDSSGGRVEVLDPFDAQGDQSSIRVPIRVQQPFKTVPNTDQLPSQSTPGQCCTHQHGVHPRDETCPDIDGNAPVITGMTHYFFHSMSPFSFKIFNNINPPYCGQRLRR